MSQETHLLSLDRRAFLGAGGALIVALGLPSAPAFAADGTIARPAMKEDRLDSYITIDTDGTVVARYGKIDGGQGLETAIAQMVADEIDVPYAHVRVVMGDTATTIDMGGASADLGVSHGGLMLRRMAAEARRLMIEMAGPALGLPPEELTVSDGIVHGVTATDKRISYADLIGGRYFDTLVKWNGKKSSSLAVEGKAPLKRPEQFKIIGQSLPRRDIPGKVFGRTEFVNDLKLPGMLHARMVRPDVAGAVPVTIDESSVAHITGVQIVHIKDLLAVVAEKEWNAVKAARALKVTWSESHPSFPGHDGLHDHIRQAPVVKRVVDREHGSIETGLAQAVRVIEGEYEFPTQSHASMGPACAVADVRDGAATVWSSTQKPYDSANCVAELLSLPRDKVRAVWMYGTGSYGRCGAGDATADAALLSQHLGRPVRVQYMRHEGIGWDPKGTASVNRSRAGIDASGKVIAYENMSKAFSRNDTSSREGRACDVLAGHLLGLKLKPEYNFDIPLASYSFDHHRFGWEIVPPLLDRASPLRTTHLRDPFGPAIVFGSESFIDEMSLATNTDPVDFRLQYLADPRERECVQIVADHYGWRKRAAPAIQADQKILVGRGIAFRKHGGPIVGLIAEVRVHRETGRIEIARIVCAQDSGMIVNPETLRQVIERQLVYGTGRVMIEEVQFDHDRVLSVDWATYPVMHVDAVPEKIEIVLIPRPNEAATGAGGVAMGLLPAAIGNAVFDATGVRLRRLPFTPERVRAALERA